MKLRKLASIFVIGALLMTGCQSTGGSEKTDEAANVAEEKTVVAATVSGSQVLDRLDAKDVYFIELYGAKKYLFTIKNNYISYQYGTSDNTDRTQLWWLHRLLNGEFKEE